MGEDIYVRRNSTTYPHHITLADCREAIKGVPGFKEVKTGTHICFNYMFCTRDSFPSPHGLTDHKTAFLLKIRRECRGLIFEETTEKIISRKLHKFFNINELEETHEDKIDLTRPHIVLEKLDGCLVAPILVDGKASFGTKAGLTDIGRRIETKFIPSSGIDYSGFCEHWLKKDYTPMFEFCSLDQQIVVRYPIDSLTLIAIRDNITGEYISFDDMNECAAPYGVPVVKALARTTATESSLKHLLEYTKGVEGAEGYVLRFHDGSMFKIKSEWYVEKHRGQARVFGDTINWHEKQVWTLALEGTLDDILAKADAGERAARARQFEKDMWLGLVATAKTLTEEVLEFKKTIGTKRDFVTKINSSKEIPQPFKPIYLRLYDMPENDENSTLEEIVRTVKKFTTKNTTLEQARLFAPNAKFDW